MRVLPYGDRAVLVEVDDLDGVIRLDRALHDHPLPGVIEVVPAARTLLLRLAYVPDPTDLTRRLQRLGWDERIVPATADLRPDDRPDDRPHDAGDDELTIPTIYDGPDLVPVAAALGRSVEALIRAHSAADWTVAFCGFAPGFAYLTGSDPQLADVPRRDSPRTRVPAGSVALAGGFSAVYPGTSPGGWQLLGRTEVRPFDVDRDPPLLLTPGRRVRFTPRTADGRPCP